MDDLRQRGPTLHSGGEGAGADGVMPSTRFIVDKAALRAELEKRARGRQTITYGEAAALVGRSTAGLAPLLTSIRVEEAMHRRPDLGALVVAVSTGLPSYVGAGQDARDKAVAVQEAVFAVWAEKD